MIERVNKDNLAEYEEFIKRHPKGLFQHSSKWAKVKSNWKWEAIMLKDKNGEIKGSAAALIRFVPVIKYSLFYICRGFVADEMILKHSTLCLTALSSLQRNTRHIALKSTLKLWFKTRHINSI